MLRTLLVVGLVLLLGTGYMLWRQVISNPRNVFTGMLENSLRTQSVSKQITQDGGAQKLDQAVLLQSGSQKLVRSTTVLTQGGGGAEVKTESIGTPRDDYVRYTDIKTTQTNQAGEQFDFSQVLGVWGRSQSSANQTGGELYGETALGIIPFGFLERNDRRELLKTIEERKVYVVDYGNVKKEVRNGRPQYTYSVEVSPENYVVVLKQFAKAVGLNQLESLDPSSFRDSPNLSFELTVDVWSRQLVGAEFVDSGRTETYGSYGAWIPTALPNEYISVEELQLRLQSIQ